jgi:hypothetical protein
MTYTKYINPWQDSDLRSAEAMNHIESQWTSVKADIDLHNHDTRYYIKTSSDATFFSLTTSVALGFDADKIDGYALASLITTILPIGAIMGWNGLDSALPTGWYVCDGNAHNGHTTPNLIERFIIGAGGAYVVNAAGGPGTWNGTITPTGSVAVGNHPLTTAELPVHDHTYVEVHATRILSFGEMIAGEYTNQASTTRTIDNQTTGDGSHGHTGSTISLAAIDPRPAWYSLYFIMKCA